MAYTWNMKTKVLFGAGKLKKLHKETLPGKKALLVTSNGKSTKTTGTLDRVVDQLKQAGVDYVLFDQIQPNPTRVNVMDGAALAKKEGKHVHFIGDVKTVGDIKKANIAANEVVRKIS